MGIKVKGQDLKKIEAFGVQLENVIKEAEGVKQEAVLERKLHVMAFRYKMFKMY